MITNVSGQIVAPIFKGQTAQEHTRIPHTPRNIPEERRPRSLGVLENKYAESNKIPQYLLHSLQIMRDNEQVVRIYLQNLNISDTPDLLLSLDGTFIYTVQNIVEYFNEHYKIYRISQRDLYSTTIKM